MHRGARIIYTHKLALIPCGMKAGILRRGKVESCQAFVLEHDSCRSSVTREDEDGLLAGEFNGIPSRREQPNQRPRTYNRIQYSNRPDPQENSRGRTKLQETSSNQRRSPVQQMHLKIRIDTTIASTST